MGSGSRFAGRRPAAQELAVTAYASRLGELAALGFTARQAEIMVQMCIYGGIPKAVEGIQAARRAFKKIDGAGRARF